MNQVRTIQVGRAQVHILNAGMLQGDLADWLRVPQQNWTPATKGYFEQPMSVPVLSALIELPKTVILVDACDPLTLNNGSEVRPGESHPADLSERLAALGISTERVEHVALTHPHFDHYSGITREQDGRLVPRFPRARHYVGRADWAEIDEELADPDSLEHKTLAVIQRHGLLHLVDRDADLTREVRILAAPGETPGHQIVRVHSGGETLYCLGDLFHHIVEVERPEWLVHWADPETTRHSREQLVAAALAEDALLMAAHISTLGRLRATHDGVRWDAV
jgi:glyoxylase-like metal-dependent hydrolase (beta-lactamase superfamily II)